MDPWEPITYRIMTTVDRPMAQLQKCHTLEKITDSTVRNAGIIVTNKTSAMTCILCPDLFSGLSITRQFVTDTHICKKLDNNDTGTTH